MRMLVTCLAAILGGMALGRGEAEPREAAVARMSRSRGPAGSRVFLALEELRDRRRGRWPGGPAGGRRRPARRGGSRSARWPGTGSAAGRRGSSWRGPRGCARRRCAAGRADPATGVARELDHLDLIGDLPELGPAVVALRVDVADQRALQGGQEHQELQQHRLARAGRTRAQDRGRPRGAAGLGEVEEHRQLGSAERLRDHRAGLGADCVVAVGTIAANSSRSAACCRSTGPGTAAPGRWPTNSLSCRSLGRRSLGAVPYSRRSAATRRSSSSRLAAPTASETEARSSRSGRAR